MTTPTAGRGSPRRDGLAHALDTVRAIAREEAEAALAAVPDPGDVPTARAVDDFVEQAADALRALDECVGVTVDELTAGMPGAGSASGRTTPGARAAADYLGLPDGWR